MHIEFVEIQNFRKLKSVRIDFSKETTVLVGANNSGKTSAMIALSHFLIDQNCFTTNDFTLCNWPIINEIGKQWDQATSFQDIKDSALSQWGAVLPSMDIWLRVAESEIHHVSHLLPSLAWTGGLLGVRLRYEPKDVQSLYEEYIASRKTATDTLATAKASKVSVGNSAGDDYALRLWPNGMAEFLEKRLSDVFTIKAYPLDPTKCELPLDGIAKPQILPDDSEAITEDSFKKLIRVDKIDAHRGFSNLTTRSNNDNGGDVAYSDKGKLSEQLRSYYKKHIDPSEMPEPSDLDALDAIFRAQKQFDEKLKVGFQSKFSELENLGYPGLTDPKLEISTKVRAVDSLNHSSVLKYRVTTHGIDDDAQHPCLPEHYNGLGYQNLISMVFRLMSFRDDWMQVGKLGKKINAKPENDIPIQPLHLVLVEEPEAHLHVQVQQVFIRKAYEILRKHGDLGAKKTLATQLVVSTHSSHIAHETEFSCLRYFRRRPVMAARDVPISTVINLSEVFGDETAKFVTRYIKSTHCDLFFADAVILVEGPAERMLVPHFIRENFPELNHSYITLLEIGGSHAHRLRKLIEHLGLITLVITDLDAAEPQGNHQSVRPVRNQSLITGNDTLKTWMPQKSMIDELLNLADTDKIKTYDQFFSVRVAYQCPVTINYKDGDPVETLASTFEDAFVFENLTLFEGQSGSGLFNKFKSAIDSCSTIDELAAAIFSLLKKGNKAEFALDILYQEDPNVLTVPTYINDGLIWLRDKIKFKQQENLAQDIASNRPIAAINC